ncbi:MAG: hypothetical protein AB7S38_34515 [Vulcanimicrobiota bacterium]
MGGVVRGIGRAIGGVVRGAGRVLGGVVKGAGQILSGHPLQGLGTIGKGVLQGAGEVLKGGLGAVKDVLGDPIVGVLGGAAAGFLLTGGNPLGAIAGGIFGPAIGNAGAGIFGAMENGVSNLFGLGPEQAAQQNAGDFGPNNGSIAYGPGGNYGGWNQGGWPGGQQWGGDPFGLPGGYGMPGTYGVGQPGFYPPQRYGCCCPCHSRFC